MKTSFVTAQALYIAAAAVERAQHKAGEALKNILREGGLATSADALALVEAARNGDAASRAKIEAVLSKAEDALDDFADVYEAHERTKEAHEQALADDELEEALEAAKADDARNTGIGRSTKVGTPTPAARRTDVYQGHLPDSGVQAHSASTLFPFVLVSKGDSESVQWGFIDPYAGEEVWGFVTVGQAADCAQARKDAR